MSRDRSPALPEKVQVTFRPYACDDATWDGIPATYSLTSELADAAIDGISEAGSGTLALRDTAMAVYTTDPPEDDPVNKDLLQTLTDRIARDLWQWRSIAFDVVFNGVIAPDLDGYTDEITWTYTAESCTTRAKSAPWDSDPESFNHQDPENTCPNCFEIYDPQIHNSGNNVAIPKGKLCLENDILVLRKDGEDSFNGCCSGACDFKVTVLDATTLDPISGVTITITDGSGSTVCSGTTGSDGIYTCSGAVPTSPHVTATLGDCTYTGPILCGVPLVLYECVGSIDYEALDDGGGQASSITYVASPILGTPSRVVSMTGGAPFGFSGQWRSSSPGTAIFCWFGITRPGGLIGGVCLPGSSGLGTVGVAPLDSRFPKGTGINHGNSVYWETCGQSACVLCGTNPPFYAVYYRKAQWLAMPCCHANGGGCVDHTNALPKTVCVTIDAPAAIVGTDDGNTITLNWDPASWDGDDATTASSGQFHVANPMVFTSGCLGPNGAGGYCVTRNLCGPLGETKVTIGAFVPFQSHKVTLAIVPTTVSPGNGTAGRCSGSLGYTNFWGPGCPFPDNAPRTCPGARQPETKPYCPFPLSFCPGGFGYACQYPQNLGFSLYSIPSDLNPPGNFSGCEPVSWSDNPTPGVNPITCCTNPYDPESGDTYSCLVDACGADPPADPTGPLMMMVAPGRRPLMASLPRPSASAGLVVRGYADSSSGYGRATAHLMKALDEAGIRGVFRPIHVDETQLPLDPFLRGRMDANDE